MAEGLSQILKSLKWYMALSPLLLKKFHGEGDFERFREAMKDRVVELYQSLLEYQIKCTIRRFYTLRVVRVAKAIIGLEDWDGKLKTFQELDDKIRGDMRSYSDEAMKYLTAKSNELQEDMVGQLRQMNRQRQQKMTGRFNSGCKSYMERLNRKPVEGTCGWFQKNEKFQKWIENDSSLLIVTADAGCGKSVLSRYLVESLLPRECPHWIVCHFFFKDQSDQKALGTGLSCVIHQLLSQTESLSERAEKVINEAGDGLKDWRVLWDILSLLLKEIENVIILFDAFDEMDPNDFEYLMTTWKEESSLNSTLGSNTKILVTTRPYCFTTDPLKSVQADSFLLQGEKDRMIEQIQEDIQLVVQLRLHELKKRHSLTPETIKALEASFEKKGKDQTTYIWVELAFKLLEDDRSLIDSTSYWTDLLETISKGHIDAYEELLKRVPSEDKEDVRIVLSIVIAAVEPFTTKQLDIALAVRKKFLSDPSARYEDEKDLERRGERMQDWIRNTCRCFVTVYHSKVYFMHQTVKEFLLREPDSEDKASNDQWHKSITLKKANATISECWIAYISIMQFPRSRSRFGGFVKYFQRYGLRQFRKCQVFDPPETISLDSTSTVQVSDVSSTFQSSYYALLDKPINDQSSWLRTMCYPMHHPLLKHWGRTKLFEAVEFPISNMMLTAVFGHYNALAHLVSRYQELHHADAAVIVIAATMGGNLECLQYLLNQDYPANAASHIPEQMENDARRSAFDSEYFRTSALHWAAIWGNRKMAQELIANGADLNAYSEHIRHTPIFYTIRKFRTFDSDHLWSYLRWMSPSQEVEAEIPHCPSGCSESVWENSLMKLFWDNGAKLEGAPMTRSLLFEAILYDDENATKFLLQNCCVDPNQDVSSSNERYCNTLTPLHLALKSDSRRSCWHLLEAGADASIVSKKYKVALFGDIRHRENVSTLHLYPEMKVWDERLLIALLDSGGKDVVNIKSTAIRLLPEWDGATCLHRFVIRSRFIQQHTAASCIEKLVHKGANINEPTNAGLTPLHFACMESTPSIAITLLRLGADPTLEDSEGRTPLDMVKSLRFRSFQTPEEWRMFSESFQELWRQLGLETAKSITTH